MAFNGYQCCFCGKNIVTNKMDVTALIAITNWDKDIENQQEQQFFCHINCFKEKLYGNVPLFLADIDE